MSTYLKYFSVLSACFVISATILFAIPHKASAIDCKYDDFEKAYICAFTSPEETVANLPNGCKSLGSSRYSCPTMPTGYAFNPPSGSVKVSPEKIDPGGSATLSWTTSNTTSCSINGTPEPLSGSVKVKPTKTANYTLKCKDSSGNTVTFNSAILKISNTTPTNPEVGGADNETSGKSVNINLSYVPLEPLVGVDQSGEAPFGTLLAGFFRILINVGAFLAVVVLVIGGITYMVSESAVTKLVGRERVKAAFVGLLILGASWIILNTINPDLLSFDKGLLSPAPGYVFIEDDKTKTLGGDGVKEATLNSKQLKKLNEYYDCRPSAGGGNTCLIDEHILMFDSTKKNNKTVLEEIKKFRENCTSGVWNSLRGWDVKKKTPPKEVGASEGMTIHICKLG